MTKKKNYKVTCSQESNAKTGAPDHKIRTRGRAFGQD